MRRIYIIDTENVKSDSYEGITALNHTDEVILFVTKNSNNITVETAIDINNSKAQIKKIIGSTGTPNALDFQITTYLGARGSRLKEDDSIYIVSGDKGFEVAIKFLKNHFEKENIRLIKSIHKSLDKNDTIVQEGLIKERLAGYYKEGTIQKFIEKYLNSEQQGSLEEIAVTINGGLYDRLKEVLQ